MKKSVEKLFLSEGIESFSAVPFSVLRVIDEEQFEKSLLRREEVQSALVFLCPYYDGDEEGRNLSLYCVPKDYHLYFRRLFARLTAARKKEYPDHRFFGVGDISPIDDVYAAAAAGLGVIGKNGLLIHPMYSSFVFIASILSDLPTEQYYDAGETPETPTVRFCEGCGACTDACKACLNAHKGACLSALTQKKGELSAEERAALRAGKLVFGCDTCQLVCPHTKKMQRLGVRTGIDFFRQDKIYVLTKEAVLGMRKNELSERAFGWRGRALLLRNFDILYGTSNEEDQKNDPRDADPILPHDDRRHHGGY